MATILDTLKKGAEYLERHEVDEARLNMEWLIAHVLKVGRMQLYLDFDRPLTEPQIITLRELTVRRGRGEPLQHLLGTVEFCELEFLTDSRALIPRPETEELTHHLLSLTWPEEASLLDMGCGSGVIGLSLAHHLATRGGARVTLADLSPEALSLARENADRLLPRSPLLTFLESDLFAALGDARYDLIVANLPYVPRGSETALSREVLRDPPLALYGGESGLEVMERFLEAAPLHLRPGGKIAMEFGIDQARPLARLAEERGLTDVILRPDLSGIERFLFATQTPEPC
jgi:release factor glutamine methyltransferase